MAEKNDDLALELAKEFAEFRKWWTRPLGSGGGAFPSGKLMHWPLRAYGPITPENIRAAIRLELICYKEAVDRLRAAFNRLPPEFRRRVAAHYAELDHGGEDDPVWAFIEAEGLFPGG